jgi:hypothetical protein
MEWSKQDAIDARAQGWELVRVVDIKRVYWKIMPLADAEHGISKQAYKQLYMQLITHRTVLGNKALQLIHPRNNV